MDSLKAWFLEVGLKKVAPSLIKTGLMALVAYISAHQGLLSSMGIDYDPKDNTIDISLNTISAWALVAIPAVATALMTVGQHHAEVVIKETVKPS